MQNLKLKAEKLMAELESRNASKAREAKQRLTDSERNRSYQERQRAKGLVYTCASVPPEFRDLIADFAAMLRGEKKAATPRRKPTLKSRNKNGLIQVRAWIPKESVNELKAFAAVLCRD